MKAKKFIPDPYQILGVPIDATLDVIKHAYRQKALQCHPDRGGSHAQMLEINAAFEVLSNAEDRKEYDCARANQGDRQAQERAAATSERARTRAGNYPQAWSEFERWLNSDFTSAEYGSKRIFGSYELPTVTKSVSGLVFIIGGGILGAIIYLMCFNGGTTMPGFGGPITLELPLPYQILRTAFFAFVGAWLGYFLHQVIGTCLTDSVKSSGEASPALVQSIIQCPNCSRKLRTPSIEQTIRITCSSCKHVFTYRSGAQS